MSKYKHIFKGAAIIVVFVLVLTGVLGLLSMTFFSTGQAATYNNQYANAYSYLQEPKDTIQIVGIGNSDLYSAVVPAEVWKETGHTGTLLCAPLQSVRQSRDMLKDFFNVQSPKLVIIEVDMVYDDRPEKITDVVNTQKKDYFEPTFERLQPEEFEKILTGQFTVFMFHDKWKNALRGENVEVKDTHSHGYHLSLKQRSISYGKYMVETDKVDPVKERYLKALEEMIAFSQDQGAEVLLVEVPTPVSWSYERSNALQQIAEKNGTLFLDMNLHMEEIGIDPKTDFRDRGDHLNYYGAVKTTRFLNKFLMQHYELEDLRKNPDYAYWQKSVEEFEKDVLNEEAHKAEAQEEEDFE